MTEPELDPSRKPTLGEVADRAGVSLATASRAMAGNYPVAAATLARINAAVEELGYQKPRLALPGQPRLIAVVGRDIRQDFLVETVAGIEEVTKGAGQMCLVASTGGDPAIEMAALETLVEDPRVGGVVVAGGTMDTPNYRRHMTAMVKRYAARSIPFVFCGRPRVGREDQAMVVDYDRISGSASAVSLLLSQGHRVIGCVRGPAGFNTSEDRTAGYRQALNGFGIEVDESLVGIGTRDRAGGYQQTLALLAARPDITALYAESDIIAMGCLAAARSLGRTVPADLSVIGFDDLPMARESWPELTTVHLPFVELGRTAAKLVLDPPAPGSGQREVLVGTHLVLRQSVQSAWAPPLAEPANQTSSAAAD